MTQVPFRLPDETAHQAANVECQRGSAGFIAQRLAELTLPCAADTQQEHSPWLDALTRSQRSPAEVLEVAQSAQRLEVLLAAVQRQQPCLLQRLHLQVPDRLRADGVVPRNR